MVLFLSKDMIVKCKKFKIFLFLVSAVLFLSVNTFAQFKKIVLRDSINNFPISNKTVVLKQKDARISLQSNSDGIILLDIANIPNGMLVFKVIGYDSISRIFAKDNVDTIFFKRESINLDAIEIKGKKNLYEILNDRYIYKVSNDKRIIHGSSKEAIKRMPLVSIDNSNTISVNGSSNIKLLIDGKPIPSSSQISSYLNSIPLNKIDKIELITDPDEKFIINGTTAVINIILKVPFGLGYFGSLTSAIGTRSNFSYDLDFSAKMPRLAININYSLRNSTLSGLNIIEQNEYRNNISNVNIIRNEIKTGSKYNYITLSGDFSIDSLSNLVASSSIEKYKFDRQTYSIPSSMDTHFINPGTSTGIDFNIDYLKSFKKNKNKLTLSILYSNLKDLENYDFRELGSQRMFDNKNISHEISGQSDYSFSINSFVQMALGLKFISRGPNKSISETDVTNYSENIPSLYSTLRYNKKKINFTAALRIENTFFKITSNESNTVNDYKAILPRAQLSYSLDKNNIIRLGYIKTIKRPSVALLSDNIIIDDIQTVAVGNSQLKPENIHKILLSYRKIISNDINISAGTSFKSINNTIQSIANLEDSKVLRTYTNSGSYVGYEVNMSFNASIFNNISFSTEGALVQNHFKSEEGIRNKGYSYNINANLYYTLDSLTQLNSSFSLTSNQLNLLGYNSGYSYSSISIDRLVLKKKMTISLRANDIFKINGRFRSEVNTKNLKQYSLNQFKPSVFQISLSYRFGKEENESSRSKLIKNDDLKTKN